MEAKEIISSGLLELYCLGMASPAEVTDIEGWAEQYPEVADEIAQIQVGMENFAHAHAVTPALSVKEKLFANLGIDQSAANTGAKEVLMNTGGARVASMSTYWRTAAAASLLLLMGSAALNVLYYNKYNKANKNLETTQQSLAVVQQQNKDMSADMGFIHNPNSMPVSLKETKADAGTNAKIFWVQNTGDVMIDASNLPDPGAGKQYQFWAIVNGVPVDGGMIVTNDQGKKFRMQKMKSFGKADAFAISLEKEGGSPAPTAVVSMGKISL